MKITNEIFKEYILTHIKNNSITNSFGLADKAISYFFERSNLAKDELKELKTDPFLKEVFRRRSMNIFNLLENYGLVIRTN